MGLAVSAPRQAVRGVCKLGEQRVGLLCSLEREPATSSAGEWCESGTRSGQICVEEAELSRKRGIAVMVTPQGEFYISSSGRVSEVPSEVLIILSQVCKESCSVGRTDWLSHSREVYNNVRSVNEMGKNNQPEKN